MTPPLTYIIFSKDRACQLDALLRSMELNIQVPYECCVLFKASDAQYMAGYLKLMALHPWVKFRAEASFKGDVLSVVNNSAGKYVGFLVDDNIFIRKFEEYSWMMELENHPEIMGLSLRLAPHVTYCYALGVSTGAPHFETYGDNLVWDLRASQGDFQYPVSVDGDIYRRSDLLGYIDELPFGSPNEFEGQMSIKPIQKSLRMCFEHQKVMNVPANIVQTVFPGNRHADIFSIADLNDKFIKGEVIDIKPMQGQHFIACHVPLTYTFEKG